MEARRREKGGVRRELREGRREENLIDKEGERERREETRERRGRKPTDVGR